MIRFSKYLNMGGENREVFIDFQISDFSNWVDGEWHHALRQRLQEEE